MDLAGISGLKFRDSFTVDNLPYPYSTDILFQIRQVKNILDGNNWITSITSMQSFNPAYLNPDLEKI